LRVRASGLSLPASICTQAFERHVHSDHFSQNLWLSRAIIEHHGGSMDLHIEGGDTCVNAHIPKAKDHSNA
jgi:sensor histidine kinase regulating citrate/malate metabolism